MNNFDVSVVFDKLFSFVSKPALFGALGLLLVVFVLSSIVLTFHWDKYAIDKSDISTARKIYFLGAALIILVAVVSVILF